MFFSPSKSPHPSSLSIHFCFFSDLHRQAWFLFYKRLILLHLYLSCLTLWDPMDCSLPGSSVHGILQARKWEWAAILFFRGFSWRRDWNCFVGRSFTVWSTREVPLHQSLSFNIYIHTSVEYVTGSYAKITNFIKRSWIIDSEWVEQFLQLWGSSFSHERAIS